MPAIDTVFTSLPQLLAAAAVIFVAELVYVLLGFGAGMIAVGGLALVMPEIRDVVVLLLLVNLPVELWVVATSWRSIRWRGIGLLAAGVVVGIPLGTWLLRWGEPTFLLTLLGLFLVVAGGAFLAVPARSSVTWSSASAPPVGLLSGILTGLFGTGGPPLILYFQLGGMAKATFRGSLMAIFLLMTFCRLPSYAVSGLITLERLWTSVVVLPAVVVGAAVGHGIHLTLREETFRRLVSIALMVIGCVLLLRRLA